MQEVPTTVARVHLKWGHCPVEISSRAILATGKDPGIRASFQCDLLIDWLMQQKFILRYMYRSAGYLEGKGRYTVLDIMVGYPVWPYFRPFYSSFTECSWKIMSQHFIVLILHYKQLHTDIIFSSLRLKIPSCIIGRIFSGFEPKPIRPIFNKNNNFLAN